MQTRKHGAGLASKGKIERFNELLLDLSAKFIGVSVFEIGKEIDDGLKLVAEFWGFDWVILAQLSEEGKDLGIRHSYVAPGFTEPLLNTADVDNPWLMEMIREGKTVVLNCHPDDLPEDARADREFSERAGIKASVGIPLKVGTSVRAMLGVLRVRESGLWADELVRALHYLGEILVSALERQKAATQIDELLRFEHLLSEISATYINLPRHEFEKVIKKDLGRLCTLLGANRCMLYSLTEDKKSFRYNSLYAWWPDEDNDVITGIDEWKDKDPHFFENLQYMFSKWSQGESVQFTSLDELPKEAERMKRVYRRFGTKSSISLPVSVAGSTVGALVIGDTRFHRKWPEDLIPRLRLIGEVFANGLMRKQNEEEIQNALSEIRKLKDRIEADYMYLREEIKLEHNYGDIVGQSDALQHILVKAKQVAPTNSTVLLLGETGTGKGLIARAIHNTSKRSDRPLVQVNCAALTPSLIESELFGHEKGAFTGAAGRRVGRFELARGTTLFLDEIGDLPLELQAKLLRVLQDGEFERVGGSATIKTDARVIAATNRDLEKEVELGRFRRDLWYRLSIFPIYVPPLRERLDDIPLFVRFFADKYGKWIGKQFDMIPQKLIRALQNYSWPGNIRELENLIERAAITSPDGQLQIELPKDAGEPVDKKKTLEEVERDHILKVVEDSAWIIEGLNGAARRLGLKPSTLRFRMKRLHITRPTNRT